MKEWADIGRIGKIQKIRNRWKSETFRWLHPALLLNAYLGWTVGACLALLGISANTLPSECLAVSLHLAGKCLRESHPGTVLVNDPS